MEDRLDALASAISLLADAVLEIEQYPDYAKRCAEDAKALVNESNCWGKP